MAEKIEKAAAPEKVKVFLDSRIYGNDDIFISVNGKRILVQTDKEVFLPKEYAEVLANSAKMSAEARRYIAMMAAKG